MTVSRRALGVVGGWAIALAGMNGCKPETAPSPTTTPEPTVALPQQEDPPSGEAIYDAIAPATVLVSTPWGLGSGVFVGEDGSVLTNYHVVASGLTEDFGIEATVTTVRVRDDGSIELADKLAARAYEVDPRRDLALLRIVDPPRKFPSVAIAKGDPRPGRKVAALGNAGVGLGWALKRCSINAVGTVKTQASAIFQSQADLPPEQRAKVDAAIAKAAAELGRQIQTDCNILPGDSGGPLVDEETEELVGLNVAIRPATAELGVVGAVATHIHVAEIRDFLAEVPDRPVAVLPDPLDAADGPGKLVDTDSDGELDSLAFAGVCGAGAPCQAAFLDLDASAFRRGAAVPDTVDASAVAKIDAELVTMTIGRMPRRPSAGGVPVSDLLAFADTDDDAALDTLLVRDGETGKTRGYALEAEGPRRKPELEGFSFESFGTLYAKKRLSRQAAMVGAALAGHVVEIDPDRMHVMELELLDGDEDGVPDTVDARTRLDRRILIDVDQDALPGTLADAQKARSSREPSSDPEREARRREAAIKRKGLGRVLRRGKLHGDVLVVVGSPTRVVYDTDHDGKYDLALEGTSLEDGVALAAWRIGTGKPVAVGEHVGLRLLRPALLKDEANSRRLDKVLEHVMPAVRRAGPVDDESALPSPYLASTAATPLPGLPRAVQVTEATSGTLVADLDGRLGKKGTTDPVEAMRSGTMDAEFAFRNSYVLSWAYYDTDNDGRFDFVAVSRPFDPLTTSHTFSIDRHGKLSHDASGSGSPMLQPDRFRDKKVRKAFEAVVKSMTKG